MIIRNPLCSLKGEPWRRAKWESEKNTFNDKERYVLQE